MFKKVILQVELSTFFREISSPFGSEEPQQRGWREEKANFMAMIKENFDKKKDSKKQRGLKN